MSPLLRPAAAVWMLLAGAMLPPNPAQAADGPRETLLAVLAEQARTDDPGFAGFAAERGAVLFVTRFTSGKPETPSCSTCHTDDPRRPGQTRAGKEIEPLAVSVTPTRFTDPEKVAKWFERNCASVIGRGCTALEKGDFLTFMLSR